MLDQRSAKFDMMSLKSIIFVQCTSPAVCLLIIINPCLCNHLNLFACVCVDNTCRLRPPSVILLIYNHFYPPLADWNALVSCSVLTSEAMYGTNLYLVLFTCVDSFFLILRIEPSEKSMLPELKLYITFSNPNEFCLFILLLIPIIPLTSNVSSSITPFYVYLRLYLFWHLLRLSRDHIVSPTTYNWQLPDVDLTMT